MIRVLLATPDAKLTADARTILAEAADLEVTASVGNATGVTTTLADEEHDLDVVVLHEDLGPLPVLDLARELNHRFPEVGVVLLTRDPQVDLLRASMSAGVRSVVRLPLTLAELQGAVLEANEWADTVRQRLASASDERKLSRTRGRVVALAGSKGGVGTTTLAVQLALRLQRDDPSQRVCLVDLDLQTGDVRSYLDLSHRRSITDLIDVAAELTTGHLTDATFGHVSGLRVLLPPYQGEDAEDLDDNVTARILGGIRARFDTVIVDVGSVTTDASATAVELADDVLVVCTPDVVSLRGANRLLSLWTRLQVREDGVRVVLNRTHRDREVQPSLASRVVAAPLTSTTLPDEPRGLETATNTGEPERITGDLDEAISALALELTQQQPAADPKRASGDDELARRVTADAGSISAEFVSLILPIAVVLLVLWQALLAGYTTIAANQASSQVARVAALDASITDEELTDAARLGLLGHWSRHVSVTWPEDEELEVSIPVPLLIPGQASPWQVTSSTTVLVESSPGERGR